MALSPAFCVSKCWRTSGGNAIFSLLVLDFEPSEMPRWLPTVVALLASNINTAVKPGFFSNWRKANLKSFITQCLHRIDFSRSAGGQPAGQQRDSKQEQRNGGERQWISGAHAVKETSHNTRQGERTGQTSDQTCEGEPYALPHDEFHHVRCLCPQRHAHADLVRAFGHRIGDDTVNSDRRQQKREDGENLKQEHGK